jgi:glyoxylase-like metal-dependent hydrolase (beta-lactamase superfamily II)
MKRLYDIEGKRGHMEEGGVGGGREEQRLMALAVGPLEVNCYIVWDRETKKAFVIDPGGDEDVIKMEVWKNSLDVEYIVNTHGHFDHVGGDAALKEALGAPIAIHGSDAGLMAEAHERGVIFGVNAPKQPAPDKLLEDGSTLKAGGLTLEVIHTPGHTPGGVCLFDRADSILFTGDTLFAGSVGRTDLEDGSYEELMESIKTRILPLSDSVRIYPGHGPDSTIGAERRNNPFIMNMRL